MNNKLLELRLEYQTCLKLANETDSKKEDLFLREEAKKILEELKQLCNNSEHSGGIVVFHQEYEGSSSYDWDDKHPESRICLICGEEESAYPVIYKEKFKKLKSFPIGRPRWEANDSSRKDDYTKISHPLKYLFMELLELVRK